MLQALIAESEKEGYWTLTAEVMAENEASRALQLKCGFREVGYRERVGKRKGVWHDVILFERRSKVAGGPGLPTRRCARSME